MTKKILIDASHAEEKRIAIINENRKLDGFEFETATRKNCKGNIYLAKVTRVEPSLQAAFIDFGGNRHGFLAFNEIHPDYYQIPVIDREKLEQELAKAQIKRNVDLEDIIFEETSLESSEASLSSIDTEAKLESDDHINIDAPEESLEIQTFGGTFAAEETEQDQDRQAVAKETKNFDITKRYKIQEVIKRNQIILVQVVKEERGNKGAALTTYLSLAGRYSVLMPNTSSAGGISRKITNIKDRKRLREVLKEVDIESKQSLIIRTAGQERTKAEIKRDFDYLTGTWNKIREKTLNSIAPSVVHEEGDLIRRVIRDLYAKDVEEILIEGEEGYKSAKNFMKALIPSHAKKVQHYKDETISLFRKFEVEKQIEELQSSVAPLPSGGSLVINITEALVAIDINSGRATKERHIDDTAFNTNMEAAAEVARQLRLRDLAGLIVIDFIDMDNHHHIQSVERRLREALRTDKARIQTGRISQFGLLELSRQRLRPSLFESLTQACKTCGGTGHVRSIESTALAILRSLEEEGLAKKTTELELYIPNDVALYLFNKKRRDIEELEKRFGFTVQFLHDATLTGDAFKLRPVRLNKVSAPQKNQKPYNQNQKTAKNEAVSESHRRSQNTNDESANGDKNERLHPQLTEEQKARKKNKRNRNNRFKSKTMPSVQQTPPSAPLEGKETPVAPVSALPKEDTKKKRPRNRRRRADQKKKLNNDSSLEGRPAAIEKPSVSEGKPSVTQIVAKQSLKKEESSENQENKKGWWKKLLK